MRDIGLTANFVEQVAQPGEGRQEKQFEVRCRIESNRSATSGNAALEKS
jgi:hypothetical protein